MNINLKNLPWKKIWKIAACVGAGVMAFSEAVGEHKKAEELELLKKTVAELKGKES